MKAQSTLEILIALFILTASITTAIMISFGNQSMTTDAALNNQAINIANKELETIRALSRQNFDAVAYSSSTEDIYLKETIVENISADTKKITSRISWQIDPLRPQKIELTTIATNAKIVIQSGGDTGGGCLSGNWKNPKTMGSVDLSPGNSATDLDVLNKIVYLASEASSAAKPDFFIVDATNGENPHIVSSINTGTGLNAVDATANYAYAGNKDTDTQLQIIDISDKNNPVLIKSFKLPDVSGSGAIGQSVFYWDSKIYMGTKKSAGPEFHIIDVSNPLNPIALGSREFNADVNAIYVSGNTAYVASSANTELTVLNVSNPSNITVLNEYDAPGDSEDGKIVFLANNKLYLGRTLGGNHNDHHELHILDVSNSDSPANLGSKDLATDLNDLRVKDYLAFLGTSDSNKEFQVWNISDPANIFLWSAFNFPQVATGIDYEDNIVYVSVRSNDALRIITSSP